MRNLLDGISLKGIIKPGEIYVITESDDRLAEIEGPGLSYTIRSEEELRAALEMEVYTILPGIHDIKEFIGWEWLSDDCCQFRMTCVPDEWTEDNEYSLYLHRMMHFSEGLEWVKRVFNIGHQELSPKK